MAIHEMGLFSLTSIEPNIQTGQGEQHDQHLSSGQERIGKETPAVSQ